MNEYETKDVNQAAFIACFPGTKFWGTRMTDKRMFFRFQVSGDITEILVAYYNGETTVEPQEFNRWQCILKDMIVSQRK